MSITAIFEYLKNTAKKTIYDLTQDFFEIRRFANPDLRIKIYKKTK